MTNADFIFAKAQNTITELESCFSLNDWIAANDMMIYLQKARLRNASDDLFVIVEEIKSEKILLKSER